jgi:hypothetical protein
MYTSEIDKKLKLIKIENKKKIHKMLQKDAINENRLFLNLNKSSFNLQELSLVRFISEVLLSISECAHNLDK